MSPIPRRALASVAVLAVLAVFLPGTASADGKPKVVATGDATLQLAQPLLRGGGQAVTLAAVKSL